MLQCVLISYYVYDFSSSGLNHWKIEIVIREAECASLCSNSSPDSCSCLKFCLNGDKVHQVILQRSKYCMSNWKSVLNLRQLSLVFMHMDIMGTTDYNMRNKCAALKIQINIILLRIQKMSSFVRNII